MFQTNIKQQSLLIEDILYSPEMISKEVLSVNGADAFRQSLFVFLQEWFNDSPYIQVQTSGSTGTPKQMLVQKQKMMQSACLTCSFLQLKAGDRALLCLSLDYIAGKMMVVRTLVAGLNLYLTSPSGNPLKELKVDINFAALVPMQVYNSLHKAEEKEKLSKIKHLIIGGGAIDKEMEIQLQSMPNYIWSTYGMTETLSHIALRRVNGQEASDYYTPFDNVKLSLSSDNTLIIDASLVCDETLQTNDVVKLLSDGRFRILGRKDNIINSGGLKIQIEEVEAKLYALLSVPFAITSVPDAKFGEALVLLTEENIDTVTLKEKISKVLPPYWQAKYIFTSQKIPFTGSGKPDRIAIKELAYKLFKEKIKI